MRPDFAKRYDEFQREAVECIVTDFREKATGRYMLVIPTGGGKTITAVKSINALFASGVLDASKDRVLWVAHRDYLLKQASNSFSQFEAWYGDQTSYSDRVLFCMNAKASATLSENKDVRLVVIDEAHHAAANTYLPLFTYPQVGVLGLTATPSRHDGKPLEFERESYSKGFPDLVEAGVVLRPEIRTITSNQKFEFSGFSDEDLDQLDNAKRNSMIIGELIKNSSDYKKVVVYVGTVAHAKNLWDQMTASGLVDHYDSISFITGQGNSRGLTREEFLAAEKSANRSIIVNVDVLTEGYDDPSVNTIVMARPTKSKLIYMQAMGRAIRHEPDNDSKTAYIVEVVDELPNIRYRIDNRWLYADISDALEPNVEDREFSDETSFQALLNSIFVDYQVPDEWREVPRYESRSRYSVLLFKIYLGPNKSKHLPIVITNDNRLQVSRFFNYLSERIPYFVKERMDTSAVMKMANASDIPILGDLKNQNRVLEAMENSAPDCSGEHFAIVSSMVPWITFFSLHHREKQIKQEVIDFLTDVVNADNLKMTIAAREYPAFSVLVRFPLPLGKFLGRIVHKAEFEELTVVLDGLRQLKSSSVDTDHRLAVAEILQQKRLPVESSLAESLSTIVRDDICFSLRLE